MSKYDPLWKFIQNDNRQSLRLSFQQIHSILGFEIDHSFLTHKKELLSRGHQVTKISMKNQTVSFERTE
jgi:hypothetical protein